MDPLVIVQTISPGASGAAVRRIQEWLTLHGHPVPVTSQFDAATSAAVSQFRQQRGLGNGSEVDAQVHAALVEPIARAISPVDPGDDFASTVLAIAERQLAQKPLEVGGPNRGPWVRLYMDGREGTDQLWCAGFVTWCLKQAAIARGEPPPIGGSVSCDALASQARTSGLLHPGAKGSQRIKPGNLFLLPKPGAPNDWFHTGIVRSIGSVTFETIEGNSSPVSQSNGDRVMSRQRNVAACDFVVF